LKSGWLDSSINAIFQVDFIPIFFAHPPEEGKYPHEQTIQLLAMLPRWLSFPRFGLVGLGVHLSPTQRPGGLISTANDQSFVRGCPQFTKPEACQQNQTSAT
jgi:hypothetical protein